MADKIIDIDNSVYNYSGRYIGYYFYLEVILNSQSTANNTSNITVNHYGEANTSTGGGYSGFTTPSSTITVQGVNKRTGQCDNNIPTSGSKVLLGTWTGNVAHNSDGTLSLTVSATYDPNTSSYSYLPKSNTLSKTVTVTTIPRASDVSVSNYSITNTTGSISATITSKANFYHRWRWKIGNGSWSAWANKGLISTTSSTVTVANTSLLAQLPTATSGSFNIEVATYSDNGYATLVGTKSASATVSVNTSNIKPSISLGNIGLNSTPISGYAVAGYSKVQSDWTTTNSSGATSVTTYFTVSTGSLATTSSSSTSGTVVSNVIPSNASNYTLTIYAYAKDSRGASSDTVSKSITVYGYQPPTATLKAYRTSSSSSTSEDGAGTYAYVTFSGAVRSSVNSQNSIQSTVCKYSGSISGTATNGGHYALADTQTVTFTLTVTDKVTSSTASVTIATASYPLDLYDDGNGNVGAGVGAVARANEFNFGVDNASATGKYKEVYCDINASDLTAYDSTLTNSSTELEWLTVLLKVICVKYPNRADTVFKGIYRKGARRYFTVYIYSTSTLQDGIPQYAFGWVRMYTRQFRIWGAEGYVPYYTDIDEAIAATNANNLNTTVTNPTSLTTYYLSWVTGSGIMPYRINDGCRYVAQEGTTSAVGMALLIMGNGTASGTAGNKRGGIRLFSTTGYYTDLYSAYGQAAHQNIFFPDKSGTVALKDTILWTGAAQGGSTTTLTNAKSYSRLRVYAKSAGDYFTNWEVDLAQITAVQKKVGHTVPIYAEDPGDWYLTIFAVYMTQSGNNVSMYVDIFNKRIGTSGQTTMNRNANYVIYRIDGII